MSQGIYPCTAADPMGQGPQDGLLGSGELPWPSTVAARAFPSTMNIGGRYTADDLDAAEFLIAELSAEPSDLSAEEAEDYALKLAELLVKMTKTARVSADKLLALKKKAEAIPVVGSVLFSTSNLPGTLAGVAGAMHAGSMGTKVENLLELTPATKKQLKKWAASRGRPGSVSPRRAFGGRIKLVWVGGNLFFEIPANAKANIYRVNGKLVNDSIRLAAYDTAREMRKLAHVDNAGYGSKGVGKFLSSWKVGAALSFGPQLAIDLSSATSVHDFLSKTAHNQPANAAAFASGWVIGMIGGPAVVVIVASLVVGATIQFVLSDEATGWGTDFGDYLMGKD
ncbi:hypothetical protein ACIPW4_10170 [Pseudomonas sp. NPDC089996]|uniref:hypothetical protein n=1 Tax=Pseudomonas sp. NPDC089996 TaxID=3364474 RepID=UPI0037FE5B75